MQVKIQIPSVYLQSQHSNRKWEVDNGESPGSLWPANLTLKCHKQQNEPCFRKKCKGKDQFLKVLLWPSHMLWHSHVTTPSKCEKLYIFKHLYIKLYFNTYLYTKYVYLKFFTFILCMYIYVTLLCQLRSYIIYIDCYGGRSESQLRHMQPGWHGADFPGPQFPSRTDTPTGGKPS